MANRFKGEVTAGDYTLRCDFNAMCDFEGATGESALDVFERFESGGVKVTHMRAMMWAFMQHHHPEATMQEAGELLSENTDVLGQVIQASSPTHGEIGEAGNVKKGHAA